MSWRRRDKGRGESAPAVTAPGDGPGRETRDAHAAETAPGARTCVDDDAHDGVRVPDGAAAQQQVVLAQPGLAPAVMHAAGEGAAPHSCAPRGGRGAAGRGRGSGHGEGAGTAWAEGEPRSWAAGLLGASPRRSWSLGTGNKCMCRSAPSVPTLDPRDLVTGCWEPLPQVPAEPLTPVTS